MTKSWPTAADAFTAATLSERCKVANSPSARTLACVFPSFNEAAVLHIRFEDVRKPPFPQVAIRTLTVLNAAHGRHAIGINTSIQRCLVKAIALHGLGLYLYSGEDLPLASDEPKVEHKPELPAVIPTAAPAPATPIRQGKLITIAQIAQIERLLAETESDRAKLLAYFGVETLAEIAVADYPRVVRSLEKRRAA